VKAIILAAGIGRRLNADSGPPKALLSFAGKTLLRRHVEILRGCGVEDISVTVGHGADLVRAELRRLDGDGHLRAVDNPDYRNGSVVSLWSARDVLAADEDVILMDADVLYDQRLMSLLVGSPVENCLLVDREIEPGEEPVKLCVKDGRIVDFHKLPKNAHDWCGESVGFFRFAPATARALAERAGAYVSGGRGRLEYEEPIRDLILDDDRGSFGFEDVTGLPWTEIDFPDDVRRAREDVLPRLVA
jgi:choline kinase